MTVNEILLKFNIFNTIIYIIKAIHKIDDVVVYLNNIYILIFLIKIMQRAIKFIFSFIF
jgi:hypothetical protein